MHLSAHCNDYLEVKEKLSKNNKDESTNSFTNFILQVLKLCATHYDVRGYRCTEFDVVQSQLQLFYNVYISTSKPLKIELFIT